MENFIVSARKYRPKAFDEVVGQKHVTNTLLNAINQNHLAQALLFTGPRGVGKTTCARILAKMVNLDDATTEDADFSFNVFELDAASNNSVDDIRNLIDQVRFAPQVGQYKVYIIDEVHMLSPQAFNAFLKTLEEPPKHAIFILATTEKHKIIPTILSRCQIYDFKRITVEDTAQHLKEVAEKENIKAEAEALHIIAQKSDGALRDALSIFDRIVSFSGKNVTYLDVIENLRILDYDYYFRTTDMIMKGDNAGLLLIFNEILDNGFDGHLFVNGLASHFRDLLVCQNPKTLSLLEVGEKTRQRYHQQAQEIDAGFVMRGLKMLSEVDYRYKGSNNERLLVELCLMQLSQLAQGEPEKKKVEPQPVKNPAPAHTAHVKVEAVAEKKATYQAPKKEPPTPKPEVSKPIEARPKEAPAAEAQPKKADSNSPKKVNRLQRVSSGRHSITDTLSSTKVEEVEKEVDDTAPDPGLPKEEFDLNTLLNQWNDYLETAKKGGRQKVYATLANKTLKLRENFIVGLELENDIQVSYFNEEKSDLLRFIREKLNNFSIQFDVTVTKNSATREPYSAKEKYEYMLAKNPNLAILKKKLGLDIE